MKNIKPNGLQGIKWFFWESHGFLRIAIVPTTRFFPVATCITKLYYEGTTSTALCRLRISKHIYK